MMRAIAAQTHARPYQHFALLLCFDHAFAVPSRSRSGRSQSA